MCERGRVCEKVRVCERVRVCMLGEKKKDRELSVKKWKEQNI